MKVLKKKSKKIIFTAKNNGFMKPASEPIGIEIPGDYRTRLMKARSGLMKTHRRETNVRKRALLKKVIAVNDFLIDNL